jgi:hypothetical protein
MNKEPFRLLFSALALRVGNFSHTADAIVNCACAIRRPAMIYGRTSIQIIKYDGIHFAALVAYSCCVTASVCVICWRS